MAPLDARWPRRRGTVLMAFQREAEAYDHQDDVK